MAMRRTGKALVVTPKVDTRKWVSATSSSRSGQQVKTASESLSKYDPSRWLLSHVTIMASVDLERADPNDPKSQYLIKPEHSIFVNNNGDCWERELLAKTYKTFIGADNYCEHVQLPEHSKGKVIDAALREVDLGLDSNGNRNTTLYVDLLIATSWEYADICNKILTGEYNAVSMGCLIQYSQCSRCGNVAKDESEHCKHISYYRRNNFYDDNGNQRIIAEICGHKDDPSSVKFIDASWVKKPAFPGAVLRNIVSPSEDASEKIKSSIKIKSDGDPLMKHVDKSKVIDTEHHAVGHFEKAAALKVSEEEPGAARFGDPEEKPEDSETGEESIEDFPAPEGAGEAGGPDDGGLLGGGDAESEEPEDKTSPEEAKETPLEDIKKEIHDGVLLQVKQQLMDQINKAFEDKSTQEQVGEANVNTESIFRENESIVKEASSPATLEYLKDKYSIDVTRIQDVRLAASLMTMASVPELKDIAKLGFNRRDAAEVLRFVDERRNGTGVSDDVVDFIANNKGSGDKEYILKFIIEKVRKPSDRDRAALRNWTKVLQDL